MTVRFKIHTTIKLDAAVNPQDLKQIIEPENSTVTDTEIITDVTKEHTITRIDGVMSVGTLLRTIDDILQTATLADDVADTTSMD